MRHIQLTLNGNWTTRIDTILQNNDINKDDISFMCVTFSQFMNETTVKVYIRNAREY